MRLCAADVWGHFAPLFHLVDVFAVYGVTLVGGRHVLLPSFSAADALLAIGALCVSAACVCVCVCWGCSRAWFRSKLF